MRDQLSTSIMLSGPSKSRLIYCYYHYYYNNIIIIIHPSIELTLTLPTSYRDIDATYL